MNFKEWLLKENDAWEASKTQIVDFWNRLKPNQPILPQPIPQQHRGSTYGSDTIRITGSGRFINSVLSRLKDLASIEQRNGSLELDVSYRQITDKTTENPLEGKYAAYIKMREKGV